MLELPIQRQAPLRPVAAQQWGQSVDTAGVGAGRHLVAAGSSATAKLKLSLINSAQICQMCSGKCLAVLLQVV